MTSIDFQHKWFELYDLLFGFAMKLTRDRTDANDLMQETVLKAFRNRNRYKLNTNFKAWTTTIMRNTYINMYRKRKNRSKVESPVESLLYGLESREASEKADATVRAKELYKTLDTLSDTYRIPFLLHFQGFEYKEIANQLDIPIGTVKSRIYSARQNLKKVIYARFGDAVRA